MASVQIGWEDGTRPSSDASTSSAAGASSSTRTRAKAPSGPMPCTHRRTVLVSEWFDISASSCPRAPGAAAALAMLWRMTCARTGVRQMSARLARRRSISERLWRVTDRHWRVRLDVTERREALAVGLVHATGEAGSVVNCESMLIRGLHVAFCAQQAGEERHRHDRHREHRAHDHHGVPRRPSKTLSPWLPLRVGRAASTCRIAGALQNSSVRGGRRRAPMPSRTSGALSGRRATRMITLALLEAETALWRGRRKARPWPRY